MSISDPTFDPYIVVDGDDFFKGEFTSIKCIDPASNFPGSKPNHVLDGTKPFNIEMDWVLSGPGATLWLDAAKLHGSNWSVDVFVESIGPGPEKRIGTEIVHVADPEVHTFSASVLIPANTLPEGNPGTNGPSGLYKVVCSCFLNSNLRGPDDEGYDISGYMEGPIIRIENPQ
jgi:hypothetical protein